MLAARAMPPERVWKKKKATRLFLEEFLQIQYHNRIIFKLHYKTKRAEDNIITGHNSNNLEAFIFKNKNETPIRTKTLKHTSIVHLNQEM